MEVKTRVRSRVGGLKAGEMIGKMRRAEFGFSALLRCILTLLWDEGGYTSKRAQEGRCVLVLLSFRTFLEPVCIS